MKVWTARAVTEAADTYVFVYSYEPTTAAVIDKVMDLEGSIESIDFYHDTTAVYIEETEVIE